MSTSTTTQSPAAQLAAGIATMLSNAGIFATHHGGTMVLVDAPGHDFLVTVTEGTEPPASAPVDPLAHVTEGHRLTEAEIAHLWRPEVSDDKCQVSKTPYGYTCNRLAGHTGPHVATFGWDVGDRVCCDPWPNETDPAPGAAAPSGEDPLAHLKVGDECTRRDLGRTDVGVQCQHRSDEVRVCSRPPGHPGQHIQWQVNESSRNLDAPGTVRAVKAAAEPVEATDEDNQRLAALGRDDYVPEDLHKLFTSDRTGRCAEVDWRGSYRCSRHAGHTGKHVATSGRRKLLVTHPWNTGEKPVIPIEKVSPDDPDPTKGPLQKNPCAYDIAGVACTRPYLHHGQHVSGNGTIVLGTEEATA